MKWVLFKFDYNFYVYGGFPNCFDIGYLPGEWLVVMAEILEYNHMNALLFLQAESFEIKKLLRDPAEIIFEKVFLVMYSTQ